jgi:hypothetical protein
VSPWWGSALKEGEHSKDNKMINIYFITVLVEAERPKVVSFICKLN